MNFLSLSELNIKQRGIAPLKQSDYMEKEFVPYELAVKLKDLGFKEKCFAKYRSGSFHLNVLGKPIDHNTEQIVPGDVSAPLWQQAFDWFREKHNLHITPLNVWETDDKVDYIKEKPSGWIIDKFMYDENYSQNDATVYKTFEEARLYCLEKLIELVTNK